MEKKSNNSALIIILVLGLILFFYFKSPKAKKNQPSEIEEVVETPATPEATPVAVEPTPTSAPSGKPLSISKEEVEKIRAESKTTMDFMATRLKVYLGQKKRYSTDFVGLGARPDQAMMKQKYGFLEQYNPDQLDQYDIYTEDPSRKDSDFYVGEKMEFSNDKIYYADRVQNINLPNYRKYCKNNCTAGKDSFEMILAVPLGDESHVDVWTVNEKNEMTMVQDGVKGIE